ncbi:hypothetical protein [Streptomyces sp. MMBL 11-3]|uniref:hypothetical protein n=1 Tax=Streptomyces sp. MMBL 11-3 TaxID=3382639 RepID=UPI0039B6D33D
MLKTLTRRQIGLLATWAAVQGLAVSAIYICWTHLDGPVTHRAWQVTLPFLCLLVLIYAVLRASLALVDSPHSSLAIGGLIGAGAIAALISAASGLAWAVGVLVGIFMMLIATAALRALFHSDPAQQENAREVLSILTRQPQDSQAPAAPDAASSGGTAQGTNPTSNTPTPPPPSP